MRLSKFLGIALISIAVTGCSSENVVEYDSSKSTSVPAVSVNELSSEETTPFTETEEINTAVFTSQEDSTTEATTTEATTTETENTEETSSAETTAEDTSAEISTNTETTPVEATSEATTIEETTVLEATTEEATAAVIESLEAEVLGTHFIGDTLNSADFTITVKYSDGSSIQNPSGWIADPLSLSASSNTINIYYENLSTQVIVNAEERPTAPETAPQTIPSVTPGSITTYSISYGGIMHVQNDGPVVCIDPGHMGHGSSALEPNGPGSTVMKARATTGTAGCVTRMAESIVNLQVSLMLRDTLLARGYNVMMTRESQDVDISNMERAVMANDNGASIIVRIHCNSVDNQSVVGLLTMSPSAANPWLAGIYPQCYNLSSIIASAACSATGAVNKGVMTTDTMTGINWAKVPVTIVEMGFMSNPTEDQLLCDPGYQQKMVVGLANGIDAYFGRN